MFSPRSRPCPSTKTTVIGVSPPAAGETCSRLSNRKFLDTGAHRFASEASSPFFAFFPLTNTVSVLFSVSICLFVTVWTTPRPVSRAHCPDGPPFLRVSFSFTPAFLADGYSLRVPATSLELFPCQILCVSSPIPALGRTLPYSGAAFPGFFWPPGGLFVTSEVSPLSRFNLLFSHHEEGVVCIRGSRS